MRTVTTRGLNALKARLHDLLIITAWAAALAGIWLNTFFHRDCSLFRSGSLLVTCQSSLDLGLMFAVALGAGLAIESEKVAAVGFLLSHITSSIFFFGTLIAPAMLGLTDRTLSTAIENISLTIVFWSQFPVGILLSLFGSWSGVFLRSRLRIFED